MLKKKLEKMSLNNIFKELDNYPYGSRHYNEIIKFIIKNNNVKYRDKYILCTKGLFEPGAIFTQKGATNVQYKAVKSGLDDVQIFSPDTPIYFEERSNCEHNPKHRQFIVNTLVIKEDYSEAIVLEEPNGNISLIGGHVDFHKFDYNRTFTEILNYNMKKELDEEVGNSAIIHMNLPAHPTYILSGNGKRGTYYDMCHLIALYVTILKPDDYDKQVKKMTVAEEHNVPVSLPLSEIQRRTKKNSVRLACEIIISRIKKNKNRIGAKG